MFTTQKLITNDGASPMYHGNTMIPPGESRLVDVPGVAPAAAVAEGPNLAELVAALLLGTIAAIQPQLPELTNEVLDEALLQEVAGQNRKTLIAALEAERIRRADEKLQAEQRQQAADALEAARDELLKARVRALNQGPDASEEEKADAEAAVTEAQAKVDALTADAE